MKIKISNNDIYDIKIDALEEERFNDFEVNEYDVSCDGDKITIELSGTCYEYGFNKPLKNNFKGKLELDDFSSEYTYAADYGYKYVEFNGSVFTEIALNIIKVDDSVIDEDFSETINNISRLYYSYLDDVSIVDEELISKIISNMDADKIINEIKFIDNVELDKDNLYDYICDNIIDSYSGELEDTDYIKVYDLLLSELIKLIKNDTVTNIVNSILDDVKRECTFDDIDITAQVYISDLDS